MYKLNIKRSPVLHTKWGRAKILGDNRYRITSGKEGNHGKLLYCLIFEDFYRKIPDGCEVHHIDFNKTNNCIMNLQLLTKPQHRRLHHKYKEVSLETLKKMSEVQIGNKNSFNPCITIRKQKCKKCKQRFIWIAEPCSKDRRICLSSVNLDTCKEKVEEFINSEKNTYGYTYYEVKE